MVIELFHKIHNNSTTTTSTTTTGIHGKAKMSKKWVTVVFFLTTVKKIKTAFGWVVGVMPNQVAVSVSRHLTWKKIKLL